MFTKNTSKLFGIGVDLVETQRLMNVYRKYGDKYLKKALHSNEITKFKSLAKQPNLQEQYLATLLCENIYIFFSDNI